MSKKNRKAGKQAVEQQSSTSTDKAGQKEQKKQEQQRLKEERDRKNRLDKVQNGLPVKLIRIVICIFVFLLFVGQPLYVHNAFNDLGTSKFVYYSRISFGYVKYPFIVLFPGTQIIALLLWIWYAIDAAVKGVFTEVFHPKKLTVPDWFVLSFMLISILSAAFAPDKSNVLWGYPGWYMGLVTMLSFGWLYFLISRFFIGKKEVIYLLAAAITGAVLAASFGILNRCGFDIFGMYQATFGPEDGSPYSPGAIARNVFISTVGHRGWYSTYLIVILPVPLYLFWKGEHPLVRIIGGIAGFILATAASASGAMAVLLGLGGIILAFLFFSFQSKKLLLRYLELQLLVFVSLQTMHLLMLCFPDHPISYGDDPTQKLIESRVNTIFTLLQAVILAVVLILVFISDRRKKAGKAQGMDDSDRCRRILGILRIVIFGSFILLAGGIIAYVVLNSFGRLPERFLSDNRLLKLDEHFEGSRWMFWSFVISCFEDICKTYPICRFLGVGPNCTYVLFTGDRMEEMRQVAQASIGNADAVLANAHNEWLTLFIDEGIFGGIAYLGIFFSVIISCIRRVLHAAVDTFWDYLPVLTAASAFGYFCHDLVSYQQISAAPFMFVLLGLGMKKLSGQK